MEHDDVDDVKRMAAGDADALGRLYDRHASALLGVARRALGDPREAEDLVHDVLLEAFRKAADYAAERGSVRTWLLVRLRARAHDRRRRAATRGRAIVDPTLADAHEVDLSRSLDGGRVARALARLPDEQRRVIELSYFEGLSCTEIAEREGLALGTVKSRAFAAMTKLRTEMGVDR